MNKLRFYTIATMVLLVVNIFLLWKMSGNGVHPRDRPRKAVIERLGLDEDQVKKYVVLIQKHRAMVKQYNGEFRQLKNALYGTLSSTEGLVNTDSLVVLMGMKQQEIEKLHYRHFQDIHALCTPEQEEKFHLLTQDIAAIFAPPHADKEKKVMRKIFALTVALTLAFLGSSSTATAQWTFRFKPVIGGKEIHPDSCYLLSHTNKTVCISTLKFYISGISLKNEKNKIIREKNSFHLINIQDTNSLTISPPLSNNFHPSSLHFFLGIDSITNSAGVKGGCLDPMQGMYWTWLSGYINLKLEGHYPADSTSFQYHLGGYRAPFNTLQTVEIEIPDVKYLEIPIDIEKFFTQTDASFPDHIMSPGKEAMQLSKITATMFPSSVK